MRSKQLVRTIYDLCVRCTSFARKQLIAHVNVRLLRVERLLPPFRTISFDDVSYSGGLGDRITRAVCDHSCAGPNHEVSDQNEVSPKKVRPKIVRPNYSDVAI